jgi:predicted dehydrogenase
MKKQTIGILCPSEIAFRRFMPSLQKCTDLFDYVGVAVAGTDEWFGKAPDTVILRSEREKADKFSNAYGGIVFESYHELLSSDIDCVYIPLPPALHYRWAKQTIDYGKHVFLEKPFTTSLRDTKELLEMANEKQLAVHENYMFQYHSQIAFIQKEIEKGTVGKLRLIRIDFGFPFRGANDFRYNKALGGGALLDCGGYTVKLASMFLGDSAKIVHSQLNQNTGYEVDIYGNAVMINDEQVTAQLSFGMDNSYRCNLDIWGNKGSLFMDRILTAPDDFAPSVKIKTDTGVYETKLDPDDAFKKSIEFFHSCITNKEIRKENYCDIARQANIIEMFKKEDDKEE